VVGGKQVKNASVRIIDLRGCDDVANIVIVACFIAYAHTYSELLVKPEHVEKPK
jgi:hypothetical protein